MSDPVGVTNPFPDTVEGAILPEFQSLGLALT
jgi:hypothetical protein